MKNNRTNEEKLGWYERATNKDSPSLIARLTRLKKFLPKNSDVLEIGCGEGYVSRELIKRGNNVIGFDKSKEAINNIGIQFVHKDFSNFKTDKKYSYIIFTEVMEHLEEEGSAILKKVRSWLKPNGIMILSVPLDEKKNPYHKKSHTKDYIIALIERRGFEILKIDVWGSYVRNYIQKNIEHINTKQVVLYKRWKGLLKYFIILESKLNFARKGGLIIKCRKISQHLRENAGSS